MCQFFIYKDTDQLIDILLVTFAKLVVVGVIISFAFFLAFASTMGPTIAPDIVISGIELDMVIRLGMLLVAFLIALFALIWFIVPLFIHIFKKFTN